MTNPRARATRAVLLLAVLGVMTLGGCTAAQAGAPTPGAPSDPSPTDGGGRGPGGGSEPGTEPGGGGGQPDDPVTGTPALAEPPVGDGALHVAPVPGVVNAIPHAIDRIGVAADGRTVTVYWWGGVEDCYGLAGVLVDRDADGRLVITVLEGARPGLGNVACIEIALLKATTITLDQPLFVDGSAA